MAGEFESLWRLLTRPYGTGVSVCVCVCGVFQRVRPLVSGPMEEVPSLHQAERRCAWHRVSAQADFETHIIAFLISGDSFLPDI